MQEILSNFIRKNDESWCNAMGFTNPYLDPYENHLPDSSITDDVDAYIKYESLRHLYDKLWIARSQNMVCGTLDELKGKEYSISYPIFIKPRWGHLSASSKNCYKINNGRELVKYVDKKDMMWSEFLDGKEGMTDYIMLNGRIVHEITYIYSDKQHGFTDEWKYISPHSRAPREITEWVGNNLHNHTGYLNVQYRNNKIIEVGMRPARSGAYIIATDNYGLINNIRNLFDKHYWDPALEKYMDFEPYYTFKCYIGFPVLYIWPHHVMNAIVSQFTNMPFREYYFEPINNDGSIFLQFMHTDIDKGLKAKKYIEILFFLTQLFFIFAFFIVFSLVIYLESPMKYLLVVLVIILYMTRLLNPFYVTYNWINSVKQRLLFTDKVGSMTPEEFDKKYL